MNQLKERFWQEITAANSIMIAGHIRPDGDCTGSCMALYQYFSKEFPQKETNVYFESVPEKFEFLKKIQERKTECSDGKRYDLFIAVDSSDKERLGEAGVYFQNAKRTICVDHHISNLNYADLNIVEANASSTAEVIYQLLEEEQIDCEIATALYLGIIHDSGVFKYENTSRKTMEIAGVLMEKGVNTAKVIDETFYQKTYVQNQILGRVLLESMMVLEGKGIVSCVTQRMMEFFGATPADLDGIIEQMRLTKGVEVAILLVETGVLTYKVSMRSVKKVNVSDIALKFGGGGHVRAAGCTMTGTFHDVVNTLLEYCEIQMK
ncbi:MAG: bifunctional oligoribonuclease/PAP phosphatase NrnA [Clostridiales bacterium]|nr:bifunctional oligoribonuclease/PAP phosphatase NrnA [Clostridiales bacterium]